MQLRIAARHRPYSHLPGTACLVPGTPWILTVFPARFVLDTGSETLTAALHITGPVREFTVQQDLERGWVKVWGHAREGFFRYRIAGDGLTIEKTPVPQLFDASLTLPQIAVQAPNKERLCLGMHKQLDWDLVQRRQDFREIVPVWLHLAAWYRGLSTSAEGGTASLLGNSLSDLFSAGFSGILCPRLEDSDHLGLCEGVGTGDPLHIVLEGARRWRERLIRIEAGSIHLLPNVPVEFHCGRFLHVDCEGHGEIDIEWSKKQLRRLWVTPKTDGALPLVFPRGLKRCRVDGKTQLLSDPISGKAGKRILLDRFQK